MTDNGNAVTYTYDPNGNRLAETTNGIATTGTYDAQDRIESYGPWQFTQTASGDLTRKTDGSHALTLEYD